jgi:cell wall-associated NlpC family hydrolase
MYKKFAAIGLSTIFITGCVTPAESNILKVTAQAVNYESPTPILQKLASDRAISIKSMRIQNNMSEVSNAIKKLKSHVGKTWYVFSGSTPSGWDCSGLTMWFYEQIGINLEHRASKQEHAGEYTKDPLPGDLVVFKYSGNESAYHVGIYTGNGKMIHAPKKGHVTRTESIKTFGGNYSDILYVRMLELS